MPGSSNNSSFIPKRGTTKHTRKVRKGGIYVLSILSSVALFASLAASAAVYFYSGSIAKELDTEISAMSDASSNFKEADLRRVKDFDLRLDQATQRLNNMVSVTSIFEAIETATAKTVRFDDLVLLRNADENFVLQASIFTDSFDSTIFQRGFFNDAVEIEKIEIVDVALEQAGVNEKEGESETSRDTESEGVTFDLFLSVPIAAVPYEVDVIPPETVVEEVISEDVVSVEEGLSEEEVEEEVLQEDSNQTDT